MFPFDDGPAFIQIHFVRNLSVMHYLSSSYCRVESLFHLPGARWKSESYQHCVMENSHPSDIFNISLGFKMLYNPQRLRSHRVILKILFQGRYTRSGRKVPGLFELRGNCHRSGWQHCLEHNLTSNQLYVDCCYTHCGGIAILWWLPLESEALASSSVWGKIVHRNFSSEFETDKVLLHSTKHLWSYFLPKVVIQVIMILT